MMRAEFDNFLYAPVTEESNGMLLRVVSVLARSNLDPWEEASRLAHLPGDMATRKLAALIAALPGSPAARQDSGTIAARLIALLPQQTRSAMPGRAATTAVPSSNRSRALVSVLIYAVVMLFLLCSQWLLNNRHSAGAEHAGSPAAGATSRPAPRPAAGQ